MRSKLQSDSLSWSDGILELKHLASVNQYLFHSADHERFLMLHVLVSDGEKQLYQSRSMAFWSCSSKNSTFLAR